METDAKMMEHPQPIWNLVPGAQASSLQTYKLRAFTNLEVIYLGYYLGVATEVFWENCFCNLMIFGCSEL